MPPQQIPSIPLSFTGKRALVTGAAGGIGRSIVEALARAGAHVMAVDINEAGLADLQRQWLASPHVQSGDAVGAGISSHTVDIGDWDATRALVKTLLPIDLLVNCAGIQDPKGRTTFIDLPVETFRMVHRINVEAPLNITQVVARSMIEHAASRGSGSVVNISSFTSHVTWPGYLAYCPSKASLDMISRIAARDLGEHNIRVNMVNPAPVMTELGRRQWLGPHNSERAKVLMDRTPLQRFVEVEEVTNVVLYLLSDYASMITGQNIMVDGGYTA